LSLQWTGPRSCAAGQSRLVSIPSSCRLPHARLAGTLAQRIGSHRWTRPGFSALRPSRPATLAPLPSGGGRETAEPHSPRCRWAGGSETAATVLGCAGNPRKGGDGAKVCLMKPRGCRPGTGFCTKEGRLRLESLGEKRAARPIPRNVDGFGMYIRLGLFTPRRNSEFDSLEPHLH